MEIVMREVDGRMGGVTDIEVEQGAPRSGIGIGTLVITEIDRGTGIGTTMGTARAVGINLETDGNLGIEIP